MRTVKLLQPYVKTCMYISERHIIPYIIDTCQVFLFLFYDNEFGVFAALIYIFISQLLNVES